MPAICTKQDESEDESESRTFLGANELLLPVKDKASKARRTELLKYTKQRIAENDMRAIQSVVGKDKSVDVYFIDHDEDVLSHMREKANVPEQCRLYTGQLR